MTPCPQEIDCAGVVCYSPIDKRHRYTGNCRQIVAGQLIRPVSGLAICRIPGESGVYLFGCDAEWNCVTDTWHETVEGAKAQAEFEYEGTNQTWIVAE